MIRLFRKYHYLITVVYRITEECSLERNGRMLISGAMCKQLYSVKMWVRGTLKLCIKNLLITHKAKICGLFEISTSCSYFLFG